MSRLTDFLKLHVWEIPKDNNEKFNYIKAIADNFDKIDEGLKNAVSKFTEPISYKGKVATLNDLPSSAKEGNIYTVTSENKNYIWNGTTWEEYASNLDLTPIEEKLITEKITEVSEELSIPNTAPVKGKLDIKSGKSIQYGEPSPDNIVPIRNVGESGSVDLKIRGRNLLKGFSTPVTDTDYWHDVNSTYFTPLEDGWGKFEYDNSSGTSIVFINSRVNLSAVDLKPNTQYTFVTEIRNSNISENTNAWFQITTNNPNIAFQTSKSLGYSNINTGGIYKDTNTTKEDLTGLLISIDSYLRLPAGTKGTIEVRISLFEGDFDITNFEYEQYQEQNITFPLAEGQLLHKGDYLAEDGIHQVRATAIPTGTEYIYASDSLSNMARYVVLLPTGASNLSNVGLCSHMKYKIGYNLDEEHVYVYSDRYAYIFVNKEKYPTLDSFKTFLAEQYANGTPVTVEYELAEEIVIPYTEEQQEAYYQLQHLLMYEGYTNITCIDEIKPDIQVTYSYNNEINTSYGKKIDSLEERIRQLEKTLISLTSEVSN